MKSQLLVLIFFVFTSFTYGQNKTNVNPKNLYVQENLDLNAVSQIYDESIDNIDFERRLNYPQDRISNLDLNNDGEVDYLRVSEKISDNVKTILIQAEVDQSIYEDVASINIVLDDTKQKKSNESGFRAKDIIAPFAYVLITILLSR